MEVKRICKACDSAIAYERLKKLGRCPHCGSRYRIAHHINSREAAQIIDCSPDDLYKLADNGLIRGGYYFGGRRRWYDKRSVVAYKRNCDEADKEASR